MKTLCLYKKMNNRDIERVLMIPVGAGRNLLRQPRVILIIIGR